MADSQFQTVFEPKSKEDMIKIAEYYLRQIKLVCPRFSYPDDREHRVALANVWADALMAGPVFHPKAYARAISLYASRASREDNPPMPGDIIRLCEDVSELIARDPVEGPKLDQWRQSRRGYFDRARSAPHQPV